MRRVPVIIGFWSIVSTLYVRVPRSTQYNVCSDCLCCALESEATNDDGDKKTGPQSKKMKTSKEEEEKDEEDKKIKTKKKKKAKTKKREHFADQDLVLDRTLPKNFPGTDVKTILLIKSENSLNKQQLQEIQQLPLAQLVCGKGSLFDPSSVPTKKATHMSEKWVWKGPFSLSASDKKQQRNSTVGDVLKLRLMYHRQQVAGQMQVSLSPFELFYEADKNDRIWLRYPQLATLPISHWQVQKVLHKESARDVPVVNRASCGIFKCTDVPPKIWLEYPQLLVEMMKCNLFKLMCQPVCGDVSLDNLIVAVPKTNVSPRYVKHPSFCFVFLSLLFYVCVSYLVFRCSL